MDGPYANGNLQLSIAVGLPSDKKEASCFVRIHMFFFFLWDFMVMFHGSQW